MSNLHQVEEKDQKLPLLCLYGDDNFLLQHLVDENKKKFRIIIISAKKPDFLDELSEIYFLNYHDSPLLQKLEESVDYAIAFLNEEKSIESLSPLMDKLVSDNSHILIVLNVFSLIKTLEKIREYKSVKNIRFALLGELLTKKRVHQKGELSKLIENIVAKHEVDLHGDNLSSVYPISVADTLLGISRLLFGNFKSNTVHYLFYKKPETILAASHIIARIDSEIKINFTEEKSSSLTISREELRTIIESRLQMAISYMDSSFAGFEKAFAQVLDEKLTPEEEEETRSSLKKTRKKKKGKRVVGLLKFGFLSLFFGSFLFIFLNLLFFGIGLLYLRFAVEDIKSDNFKSVVADSKASNYFLSLIKPTTDLTFETVGTIDALRKIEGTYLLLQKAGELSQLTGNTVALVFKTNPLSEKVLATVTSNFSFLYQEGQRIRIETNNATLAQRLKQTYSKLLSLSEVLPVVLGFHGDKSYLLLFQNDDELRPTGGFIGSVGDLTVSNGKVATLSIQDVYELDGQLRNHVEPPFIVRRYLQPHLYLRDSNFALNYQEAASQAAFIYNLETGKKPAAVVAVDLEVLRKILKISGPIQLASYNLTVTSDTVSQLIQSTVKNNFFPGSTQKRDILNSLFTQLLLKTSTNPKFYAELAKLLPDLLEQKDILISFSDNSIQKVFSANGYGGEFTDTRSNNTKTINDVLYINEANIGENKANANITRSVDYTAMIEQGRLASKAILTLTNSGASEDYKAYVRLAVPKGSVLRQIVINGTKQAITPAITDFRIYEAKNFKPPIALETEQFQHENLTNFAFVVTVNRDAKSDIEVDYDNSAVKTLSTIADYSLLYIKQPGTQPYLLTTTIDYPEGYVPVDTTPESSGKNFLEQTTTINKDFKTQIEIRKASVQK